MALPCHIHMEDQGLVGEDDGTTAWSKVDVYLMVAGRIVRAHILTEGYSGEQDVKIVYDQIGLEPQSASTLLLESYNIGGATMRWLPSDVGLAFFDLETLIRDLFYRVEAERVIRKIRSVA